MALKTEVDEATWSSFDSHEGPPGLPSIVGIAVKIINHSGDEIASVYDV